MLVVLLTAVLIAQVALCLQMVDLAVPAAVISGDPVWLNCTYNLESDKLYSIKWYKNNIEFYRYLPTDEPPGQKYDLLGIYLDLEKSKEGHIFLHRTDVHSEGNYRCEVSADAPSFQTVRDEKEMRIYVSPKEKPTLFGIKSHYRAGDQVDVTCKSAPSKPAAFLKWFINDQEASPDFVIRLPPEESPDGLLTATLRLKFVAQHHHFRDSTMRLRCVAIISQGHSMSSEEIMISNNPKTFGNVSSSGVEGPTIKGGRLKYQVGDTVNVTCTAAKSQLPAELHWYINDREARPEFLQQYAQLRFPDGQESTVLGLKFEVKHRHFQKGEMRLKCTATLSKVINMSSEEMVVNNRQQSSGLHVSENQGAVSSQGTRPNDLLWCFFIVVFLKASL